MNNLLERQIDTLFSDLEDCLNRISSVQYRSPSTNLSGSSIGQHMRHIIELFGCLVDGYEEGLIDYDARKRDLKLETDPNEALSAMKRISNNLRKPAKQLGLSVSFGDPEQRTMLETNYLRELVYNLEHTIHHMALIRIGFAELTKQQLPAHFGVAPSTLQFRKQACAQ
jgi:hypothetical protein